MKTATNVLKYSPGFKFARNNQTLVLVGGCFDVLHYGHLQFLKAAKKEGDILLVVLESDEFIRTRKHREPVHSLRQRAEMVSALGDVDYVLMLPFLKTDKEYAELVDCVKPDVIAVTEGDSQIENKKKHASRLPGGTRVIAVTPFIKDFSTTNIINRQNKNKP